ncbi:hypothetical protein EYF80_045444 [Liparis tanakae]|uniref:Uncharacterized protein n=1 Tax=Liparis tanakae TaxID=230148 RepID=A0A4Z2FT61_9TELE|nr:hypothetical protein EYF80_045444 [Liparis tanakae]
MEGSGCVDKLAPSEHTYILLEWKAGLFGGQERSRGRVRPRNYLSGHPADPQGLRAAPDRR